MTDYFVTGTDTGVGKTFVTCGLARAGIVAGKRVFAFKPVETGCADGQLGEDQRALCAAAGDWQRDELQGLYRLRRPVAPLVAAREHGIELDVDRIAATVDVGRQQAQLTLVEGAGGWRVPLTERLDIGGLARALGFPVVVVARAGLGTINHALLTVEAIERDGCAVAGVVLSQRPEDDPAFTQSNRQQIQDRWSGRVAVFNGELSALEPFVRQANR